MLEYETKLPENSGEIMCKSVEEFNDTYPYPDLTTESATMAMKDAETFYSLACYYKKEALRVLAEADLIFGKTADDIDEEYRRRLASDTSPSSGSDRRGIKTAWDAKRWPRVEIDCSRLEVQERLGLIYSRTAEINYPPQVKERCGTDGMVIHNNGLLHWFADTACSDKPEQAELFRQIADEFYPVDEYYDDDEDDSGDHEVETDEAA